MGPFALISLIFEPAFRVVLTVALLALDYGLEGAMVALLVTNVVAAVLAAVALRRLTGELTDPPRYVLRELFSFSAVSWAASLAGTGLVWADTIILGIYRSAREVGVYSVATRLTLLATVVLSALTSAFAPQIADLYRRGNLDRLSSLYRVVTSWILRLSLPAFVVLVVFPKPLLRIFGPGFAAGAAVTVILAAGQLFDVATGPTGYMLVMSGRPILTMANNLCALVLNIGLNVYLIPRYGIRGAAVAWALSIALINVAKVVQVWATMRMLAFDAGFMKGCVAGAASLVAGVGVHLLLPGQPGLIVGTGVIVAVHAAVLLALGLHEEDRVVLRKLGERVGL